PVPGCPKEAGRNWYREFQFRQEVAFLNGTIEWNATEHEIAYTIWVRDANGDWGLSADGGRGVSPLNFSFDARNHSTTEIALAVWPPSKGETLPPPYSLQPYPFTAQLKATYAAP
ncbi:MAG TPA: hypothetical protein VHH36_03510, partial [Candidatus Thermoplasmatota archaeon]|nr:hypothetical protein [Candidatus Thermoplasmatota archaeon]